MDMLIAEDVMLLLLDDATGSVAGSSAVHYTLGGAVLVELALAERVWIEPSGSAWRTARVHPVPGAPPLADPLLQGALGIVAEKPRSAQDLVNRLGKGLREHVAERLVNRGLVRRETTNVLGLFPSTRWPAQDARHEQELRGTLELVLARGAVPDARTGAVVALLSAADQAHRVLGYPGIAPRDVKARAKVIAEGDWAAKAVKDAVAAMNAAVIGAIVATTVVTGSSS
ncbi:GPP34 family phosphoprotein [Serinibacter arcticus]|uniref:GPP34 family phosphoprotein n=1 Tax=Serinibacter arcticus TaxID=1655435 RepID=A0A2U1ZR95_9MICO|nr:GPP34 family phosphoprotein [Serinibacter arcticus]PWD49432.1 GPP34 family phosphoprotein [Serinibacter arcticus]